jgi:hypothetical protein
VLFEPREVVVVVDLLFDAGSQQTGDTSADPVAARVGVDATELHGSDVLRAEIARYIIPSLAPAALRNHVAMPWPRPREPKCTPTQTWSCSSTKMST